MSGEGSVESFRGVGDQTLANCDNGDDVNVPSIELTGPNCYLPDCVIASSRVALLAPISSSGVSMWNLEFFLAQDSQLAGGLLPACFDRSTSQLPPRVRAQGFSVQSSSPTSVVAPGRSYPSKDGSPSRFPRANTAFGGALTGYTDRASHRRRLRLAMKEGSFTAGYADTANPGTILKRVNISSPAFVRAWISLPAQIAANS